MKTTINSGNPVPTAHVTVNKNRLKVYSPEGGVNGNQGFISGTYYLKNGQTFEIELFNPTKSKVRADIKIDGRLVTAGGLVLNPGERTYLERFVESNNKFLFETYEVEDTDEVREAISDNGRVTVEFYREYISLYNTGKINWVNYGFDPSKHPDYPKVTYYGGNNIQITPFYPSDFNVTANTHNTDFTVTPINGSTTNNIIFDSTSSTSNFHNTGYVSGADAADEPTSTVNCFYASVGNQNWESSDYILTTSAASTTETGRTEKGGASDQTFESINANFEYLPFETVGFNLLPISKKVVSAKETVKNYYCPECGSKVKAKFKFCPKCGEKL